ncbi:MAG: hypothetical protein AABZ39_17135, partial [Spirochaetota bacterium]
IFAAVSSNYRTNTWYQTNVIDNSAPISVVTNYVHGSVIAGTINIRGTNYENWSAITANVLYTNDGFYGATAATSPWDFALNSTIFTNGVMKLVLISSNGVGFTYTNTWSNYVSNGTPAPTITISSPAANTWITNSTVPVSGAADSGTAELTGVYFSTNATLVYNPAGGTTTNWLTNVNVTGFPITNVFYAVASNEFGLVVTNCQTNFIDLTAPVADITNITALQSISGVHIFRGTNSDLESGILSVVVQISNAAGVVTNVTATAAGGDFSASVSSSALLNGAYSVLVVAVNNANIMSVSTSIPIVVTNRRATSSTVAIVAPNPYRPNGTDPRYGAGQQWVMFAPVSAGMSIEIYTVDGKLITRFPAVPNAAAGHVWTVPPQLASGLYLVRFHGAGTDRTIKWQVIK